MCYFGLGSNHIDEPGSINLTDPLAHIALVYLANARQTSIDVAVHVCEVVGATGVANQLGTRAEGLSDDVAVIGHTSIDVACHYRAALPHTGQHQQLSPSLEWRSPRPILVWAALVL